MEYTVKMERDDDLEIARDQVAKGYRQISRTHRHIARLPEGETGLEALKRCAPDAYREFMRRAEQGATDYYRRVYADTEGNTLTLDSDEFAAFKKAGGEASW